MFPCANGHAQERSLLSEVLPTVVGGDLLMMDRKGPSAPLRRHRQLVPFGLLLVMGPHSEHFDRPVLRDDLIDESVLNIDSPGICPGQVANEFFERWGSLS